MFLLTLIQLLIILPVGGVVIGFLGESITILVGGLGAVVGTLTWSIEETVDGSFKHQILNTNFSISSML